VQSRGPAWARRAGFIGVGSKIGARFAARRAGWEDFARETGLFRAAAPRHTYRAAGRFDEGDSEVVFSRECWVVFMFSSIFTDTIAYTEKLLELL
jgi:hypothetical protein